MSNASGFIISAKSYFLISAPSCALARQHEGKQHFHDRKMLSSLIL